MRRRSIGYRLMICSIKHLYSTTLSKALEKVCASPVPRRRPIHRPERHGRLAGRLSGGLATVVVVIVIMPNFGRSRTPSFGSADGSRNLLLHGLGPEVSLDAFEFPPNQSAGRCQPSSKCRLCKPSTFSDRTTSSSFSLVSLASSLYGAQCQSPMMC